ncbi:MAG: glycosyltransferase family 4 protein [Clostridiaceae bacterium]|nr:glycosyltransferase family 4 protein [Clostridiaceae bacterium]
MKQIKITFFSGDITRSGGTERVGTLIANALSQEEMYQVSFVSLTHGSSEPAYEIAPEISRTCLSKKWIRPGVGYLPLIVRLICYLKKNQTDILIDIDGVLDVLSVPAKWMTRVVLISWEHFNFYKGPDGAYRKWIRKLTARYADAIVTLTEQDRHFYEENMTIRHRVQSIPNPIDYMKPPEQFLQRDYRKKRILSVGRLSEQKGFLRVPQIAAKMKEKHPELNFQWLIVGEGEQRAQIEEQIQYFQVENEVLLPGYATEVEPLYEKALVYVMTSVYEGLPMVLLEAKMYRLPCVSFDILTGPSEIIQNGLDGYLIRCGREGDAGADQMTDADADQMADAIAGLLTDQEQYSFFSAHTQDNMDSFRMDAVIKRWKRLLEELCGEKM